MLGAGVPRGFWVWGGALGTWDLRWGCRGGGRWAWGAGIGLRGLGGRVGNGGALGVWGLGRGTGLPDQL